MNHKLQFDEITAFARQKYDEPRSAIHSVVLSGETTLSVFGWCFSVSDIVAFADKTLKGWTKCVVGSDSQLSSILTTVRYTIDDLTVLLQMM